VVNSFIKICSKLKKLLSSRPVDKHVSEIVKLLDSGEASKHQGQCFLIAVQGVEDPLYLGLFAALLRDLRDYVSIEADVIQVRSINGAVGKGVRSGIGRSWIVANLINNQWARVYSVLIGPVAYRSQPLFWRSFLTKYSGTALNLWDNMKALDKPEQLIVNDIQIGDLVIDTYLRFRPSPRFDVNDHFVLMILRQALRDLDLAYKYFSSQKPQLYLSSYSCYVMHGIPARVAVSLGINVRTYGNYFTPGNKLTREHLFHVADTSQYRDRFDSLSPSQKQIALEMSNAGLQSRLSGGIDAATIYMKESAYEISGEAVPDVGGSVVVFLHDFFDSPHGGYKDLLFTDFWAWICFTIVTLQDGGVPFWIKPHPNQISQGELVLVELKKKFPEARFLSSRITNNELVQSGMCCGVTVYGTVAHELAYLGVPSIACARHPHFTFDFCRTAKSIEQYRFMLLSPNFCPLSKDEMRQQALAFYYMHNFDLTAEQYEFKSAFVRYCKIFDVPSVNPKESINALNYLTKVNGWRAHIREILSEIISL